MNDFDYLKDSLKFIESFNEPWFVVGGWAIDLFLGHKTREHHDVDVGIFRKSQLTLQELLLKDGWRLEWMQKGVGHPWEKGQYLELPIHEIWGFRSDPNIEILLNESDENNWQYRRDISVSLPRKQAIFMRNGIPYLAPEATLMFKSRHIREVDNQDFKAALPKMSAQQRSWLRVSLVSQDPQHTWLVDL